MSFHILRQFHFYMKETLQVQMKYQQILNNFLDQQLIRTKIG